jgi:predicted Rossmann fold flavoprotein
VAHGVELALRSRGRKPLRIEGPMLFTHFGVSGPAALDASRHLLRARLEGLAPELRVRFVPGADQEAIDRRLLAIARERPRLRAASALQALLPASLAEALVREVAPGDEQPLGVWPREQRRRLARALDDWPLPVVDSRGYGFAEVTAGGVPLTEIDPGTMESRVCPGLHLVGEILDVDGRLGGFNFQWAWSSGFVAARGVATAAIRRDSGSGP